MKFINFNSKWMKMIGSLVVLLFYYYLGLGIIGYTFILTIIGFTVFAFFSEKERITMGNESFHGDNLFFRYGTDLSAVAISIPVKDFWKPEESEKFGNSLLDRIKDAFTKSYGDTPIGGKQLVSIINVTDSDRTYDSRFFLKVSFTGMRGAIFSRFISYQLVGQCVVLHKLVYLLGIAHWYDLLFFFLTSPFTIAFWIISWFRNEYSIYAQIARNIGNSFEILDMRAYFESSASLITDATIEELKANDLYSEELRNNIINTFNFNGNIVQKGSGNTFLSQIK